MRLCALVVSSAAIHTPSLLCLCSIPLPCHLLLVLLGHGPRLPNSSSALGPLPPPPPPTLAADEIQLLTYWLCYMYPKSPRSVSICTPAYLAHWGSKRARELVAGGVPVEKLIEESGRWLSSERRLKKMQYI